MLEFIFFLHINNALIASQLPNSYVPLFKNFFCCPSPLPPCSFPGVFWIWRILFVLPSFFSMVLCVTGFWPNAGFFHVATFPLQVAFFFPHLRVHLLAALFFLRLAFWQNGVLAFRA